jgi:hypothetical protein
MRFEVIKRETEIRYLNMILAGKEETECRRALASELQQLDDDFAFIANCNLGDESMRPQALERLARIAKRTWTRTLDDRLGVSHEELTRKAKTLAPSLPVTENLVADKADHIYPRETQDIFAPDNPWGFRMKIPPDLYNKGELHNLSVTRGTLTDEERFKINEHIIQTEIMLRRLPFPKHLRQVPEIAVSHHERMDGAGYPKGLTGKQMSPLARMMAIADIYEALTAADRPYKKGKTLSEAIKIMALMKKEGHIDPELFDLFLTSGVYLDYAHKFLQPEQIDQVDINQYIEK